MLIRRGLSTASLELWLYDYEMFGYLISVSRYSHSIQGISCVLLIRTNCTWHVNPTKIGLAVPKIPESLDK